MFVHPLSGHKYVVADALSVFNLNDTFESTTEVTSEIIEDITPPAHPLQFKGIVAF